MKYFIYDKIENYSIRHKQRIPKVEVKEYPKRIAEYEKDLQAKELEAKLKEAGEKYYIRTKGKAFEEIYDTNGLNKEEICRVRLLTANQDFRGSRNFIDISKIFVAIVESVCKIKYRSV